MSIETGRYMFSTLVFFLLLSGVAACGQAVNSPVPDSSTSTLPGRREPEDAWTLQQKKEMEKKRNLARQADIKKDTDKLLELATELKEYVDKTNESILSMDVIKKAEQIEKLAKQVKEKMKGQ